ncbi:hypothetical protein ElyMa_002458400 [Elysia marginata]|uniref:Uncharacterized protein n=1 Tax=Elysia marginata TaxID=1093978 RepID=A0AAV4GK10_9GAST|nr:hypothetical protein ElyMa_002458400 [Elysia marginata]
MNKRSPAMPPTLNSWDTSPQILHDITNGKCHGKICPAPSLNFTNRSCVLLLDLWCISSKDLSQPRQYRYTLYHDQVANWCRCSYIRQELRSEGASLSFLVVINKPSRILLKAALLTSGARRRHSAQHWSSESG